MTLAVRSLRVVSPDDSGVLLLDGIDFDLRDGTVTLLIGRTGSGKSTLLQQLAGIREPDAGSVCLDGEPIWRKSRVDRKHLLRFGLTFQFPEQQLFARTIGHEFAYSLRPYNAGAAESGRRIEAAIAATDRRGALAPDRSPFSLSGGEQRRLAMATTYATEPDWLLMDEPTAGLESAAVGDLLRYVDDRRQTARGGIVIATHDLDALFPIADRIILLAEGRVVADGPPELFCRSSELLVSAGVGVPGCVRLAEAFVARGLPVDPALLTPERMAAAIAETAAARTHAGAAAAASIAASPTVHGSTSHALPHIDEQSAVSGTDVPASRSVQVRRFDEPSGSDRPPNKPASFWFRIDPRAKWLVYMTFVVGTMLQHSWTGLVPALLLAIAGFAGLSSSALRGIGKIAKPFGLFMLVSVLLSGLDVSFGASRYPVFGFASDRAAVTGLNVSRLFLVTAASYWLASTTPFGRMVQGLDWALAFGRKLKVPLDSFALAVSLVFRFIPIILREWQRFSAIVRARGKAPLRPGTVRVRDIPALVVPLLLSLFQRAEDMTMAMEMKQTSGRRLLPTGGAPLVWTRKESLAVAVSLGWLALMAMFRG